VNVDWTVEFDRWLDRTDDAARKGDAHAKGVMVRVIEAISALRALTEPPEEEVPSLKRVRQSKRHQLWRTSHPYVEGIAVRLICWFPPKAQDVVVIAFASDKAPIGDVFYDSVASRADAAIDSWKMQTDYDRK